MQPISNRGLLEVERAAIKDVEGGQTVKIVGTVHHAATPLLAPISGRECACWQVDVLDKGRHSEGLIKVRPLAQNQGSQVFFVEDKTGRALVHAHDPFIDLKKDARLRTRKLKDPSSDVRGLIEELGLGPIAEGVHVTLREGLVAEGEDVAVWGMAHWAPDHGAPGQPLYRSSAMRLEISAPLSAKLYVSDRFRDRW